MPRWLAARLLFFLMLFSSTAQANIALGDYMPETFIYDDHGQKVYLDQFEGKATLLVFWAGWSSDCPEEMIKLDSLAKDFKNIPLNIVAVSLDYQKLSLIDDFYKKYEIRHLAKYYDHNHQLFKLLATNSVPTSYLINSQGRIIWQEQGPKNWHQNEIRATLLEQIEYTAGLPRNSFKEGLLRSKILK